MIKIQDQVLKKIQGMSKMIEQVEISSLDLRFEGYRMRSKNTEKGLLHSILENGIHDPLQGVDSNGVRVLLNGFKRYRCAKNLDIRIIPYSSFGSDEAHGIITLLRHSNVKALDILEQARLIEELRKVYQLNNTDIAGLLERSKGWVSMRAGLISEMSDVIMERIFKGEFPSYAYMYTIRKFMRMNKISMKDVEEFVVAVSGRNLSVRDIETLACGYFKGSDEFREQVKNGNISWGLNHLKNETGLVRECTEVERLMLKDLDLLQKYMNRIIYKVKDERYKSNSFFAQSNLLTGGILKQIDNFSKAIREFHDKTGQA